MEAELNGLDKEEAEEFLAALGVEEGGLKSLIRWGSCCSARTGRVAGYACPACMRSLA